MPRKKLRAPTKLYFIILEWRNIIQSYPDRSMHSSLADYIAVHDVLETDLTENFFSVNNADLVSTYGKVKICTVWLCVVIIVRLFSNAIGPSLPLVCFRCFYWSILFTWYEFCFLIGSCVAWKYWQILNMSPPYSLQVHFMFNFIWRWFLFQPPTFRCRGVKCINSAEIRIGGFLDNFLVKLAVGFSLKWSWIPLSYIFRNAG